VFLLHLDCSAPEVTQGDGEPRLPRLGCEKEPSQRAELAEDRVVVLEALIARVVACFGAGQVVDAVPNRRPEAVSLTVDASRIVFSKAGDDRVELAFSRPLASSKRAASAALMWLKSEASVVSVAPV
jgi:hypothetical protein